LQEEQYDFAVPRSRWDRPAVRAFRDLLGQPQTCRDLEALGFRPGGLSPVG
jgi:putative molybdopterin biosynthesis protein